IVVRGEFFFILQCPNNKKELPKRRFLATPEKFILYLLLFQGNLQDLQDFIARPVQYDVPVALAPGAGNYCGHYFHQTGNLGIAILQVFTGQSDLFRHPFGGQIYRRERAFNFSIFTKPFFIILWRRRLTRPRESPVFFAISRCVTSVPSCNWMMIWYSLSDSAML